MGSVADACEPGEPKGLALFSLLTLVVAITAMLL